MKDLIIFGGGSITRETIKLVKQINSEKKEWNLLGIVGNASAENIKEVDGVEYLSNSKIKKIKNVYAISAVGSGNLRKKIVKTIENYNFKLATLIHPSAYIYNDTKILEGTIVFENAQIGHTTHVGKNVLVSFGSDIGHNIIIGSYTSVLPLASIGGYCVIGNDCIIGSGANIKPEVNIGENCSIGIGTIIINNVKKNCSIISGNKNIILTRKTPENK